MNPRQKNLLMNFVIIMALTAGFIFIMTGFKDYINKTEALRAMEILRNFVTQYRQEHHSLPPENLLNQFVRESRLVRLGQIKYRALWVSYDSPPETILVYSEKSYRSFIERGCVVMRLNGKVEWMDRDAFEKELLDQQSEAETRIYLQEK